MSDIPAPLPERIEDLHIERELQDSYLTYAMSTIMDRALPDVRDGLKPSQRRILVAMNDLGLGPRSKHRKCAKIAGDTSGNYHPHGEAVIYPTLVRLAQHWNLRYKLIDGQGNFGSTDGDPPAAMRYTEARMSGPAMELLDDMNLDTVDFQANYDETRQEPMVLPSKFPNLLVNGSTGIAVGMACNLLPHNLREIADAIVHVIDNPDCSLQDLLNIVPGPDFPTAGVICGRDGILEGYKSGRGKITLRAKITTEDAGKNRQSVIIEEIPYGIIRKSIVESVAECVKKDLITDISAINDESGREHACRIVVDLKRDADPNVVINQLYQYTPCQITVSMINIALVNRQPRTMGLKELIEHFIAHRKEVITRRTKFLLRKAQQRGHILEGLIFAVCDIDEVIKLIRSSGTRDEAIEKLRQRAFRIAVDHPHAAKIPQVLMDRVAQKPVLLSQAQAEAIGRLQLIQLVGLEIEKLVDEYREVAEEIEGYEAILRDVTLVMDIIREDTFEMKEKYGDERRTQITGSVSGFNMESLIAQEDVVVTVSHEGYIKRIPVDTYRAQGRGGRGIKGTESREGDFVEHLFVANTHDYLLFFTNQGRVYERRVYDVPEGSRTSQGRSVANLLEFQKDEKIANVLAIKDFGKDEQFLMFATKKGTVKKTALSAYSNIRTNGLIAIGLDEGDSLIGVEITGGKDHIILATKSGLAIRFEEADVRAMGRPAGGVTGARFKRDGDEVIDMIVVANGENACCLLTACVNGYGKRTPLADYPVKGRGTRGVISIDANDRNGEVVGMKLVDDNHELMLITEKGILIRTRVSEIRETGRNAAGVRLIKIDEGDRLVAMARVDAEVVVDEAPAATPELPPTDSHPKPDGETQA
ncbi:MAG TPA: DNA gyrase subunit A [Tepidisphaeraceae bacterium]|jgi:DNA gyrase subunit A|nr:DNA gyrase subunit A [Tepidisphaeraceae bacterium]